jgi:hypothetical protein
MKHGTMVRIALSALLAAVLLIAWSCAQTASGDLEVNITLHAGQLDPARVTLDSLVP